MAPAATVVPVVLVPVRVVLAAVVPAPVVLLPVVRVVLAAVAPALLLPAPECDRQPLIHPGAAVPSARRTSGPSGIAARVDQDLPSDPDLRETCCPSQSGAS